MGCATVGKYFCPFFQGYLLQVCSICCMIIFVALIISFSAGGPIAQLVERSAHNRLVTGSSPVGPTIIVRSGAHDTIKEVPSQYKLIRTVAA